MNARSRFIAASLAGLLLILASPSAAWAKASGRLDSSFGHRGKALTDFGGGDDEVTALAVQSDGKIVAAGGAVVPGNLDFALARYTPKGNLDTTFGNGGKVVTDFGALSIALAVAIQPDGKIVAAGHSRAGFNGDEEFALARYNSDGALDTTFGSGGKVLTDFSGTGSDEVANALGIQSDGRIVAAGGSNAGGSADFALARYNSDGALDTTFGSGGKVLTDFSGTGSFDGASALRIQSDGRIVAAGNSDASGSEDFALARYSTNGTLDPTFGNEGKVITDFSGAGSPDVIRSLGIQSDGRIVAADVSYAGGSADFALARYKSDGTLDATFGNEGEVLTDFSGAGSYEEVIALAIQNDGRIVAAGLSDAAGSDDFALARYNSDGTLDPTFGNGGKTLTDVGGSGGIDVAFALAIQSNGKIVAAGYSAPDTDFSLANFALAQYRK
jgi:uncharacterized delta-60 repeat protein